jgi:beta-glucosidase
MLKKFIFTMGLAAALMMPVAAAPDRVESLLSQMTIEEKVGQLVQHSAHDPKRDADFLAETRAGSVGSFLNLAPTELHVNAAGVYEHSANAAQLLGAERINRFQHEAVEHSRLHIPLLVGQDVIHGFRTIYPVPLAEAASFDPELCEKTARMAASECSAVGIRWTFAPMVDIARDPRWGRIVEGSGEDPYLGSAIAAARVKGFQGTLSSPTGVLACAKHYLGYGFVEAGLEYSTADISERTVRDVIMPPFHAAAKAGVGSFMVAFNEIGGVPSSANRWAIHDVLRGEWGWDGLIVSDWSSVGQLVQHGIAYDDAEAARLALHAGVDMDMESKAYSDHLVALVKSGRVPPQEVDDAVRRVLRAKEKLGLFEHPYVDPQQVPGHLLTPANRALARQSARESMVLLKNQRNVLPLRDGLHVALIGPLADSQKDLLGSWAGDGRAEDAITVLKGLQASAAAHHAIIHYARGCSISSTDRSGFGAALAAAKQADVVIMALGEGGEMSGELHSRSRLDLPGVQQQLLEAVVATGKPVVLVLMNGRPLTLGWADGHCAAILESWFLGTEAGPAIADVLFGAYNPAGRLPATFPRALGQVPIYYNRKLGGRWDISKYDDIEKTPQYVFGYGLSYTAFRYDHLTLSERRVTPGQNLTVGVDVTNTGKRSGDEVAQLYIHQRVGTTTRPVLALKGFQRLHDLKPGETRHVQFTLTPDDMSAWDLNMHFTEEDGVYDVQVGPSYATGLKAQFTVFRGE